MAVARQEATPSTPSEAAAPASTHRAHPIKTRRTTHIAATRETTPRAPKPGDEAGPRRPDPGGSGDPRPTSRQRGASPDPGPIQGVRRRLMRGRGVSTSRRVRGEAPPPPTAARAAAGGGGGGGREAGETGGRLGFRPRVARSGRRGGTRGVSPPYLELVSLRHPYRLDLVSASIL